MLARKFIFALVTVGLIFGLLELGLWAAGVETLISRRDPFAGFSRQVRLFELDSGDEVWRTPGRATQHSFNFQQFAADKPDDGYRIFALGGSSAYGFPWGAEQAFPHVLAEALTETHPDRSFEAINAAAMSYGSHRLRILMHELVTHEPDLFVIYSGHNEFIERRFYSDHLARPKALDGLTRVLSHWRLYSLLADLRDRAATTEAPTDVGQMLGIDVDRETPSELVSAERSTVLERYRENLIAIVELARGAGAEIVLCTVPSNIADWKPNASRTERTLTAAEQRELEELLEREDPIAAERFPDHAQAWYVAATAHERAGRTAEAREAFVRARDLDAAPSRAPSAINAIVREVATETDAYLVDVERAFEEIAPDGLLGFNLFEDYVHPKPGAHARIAFEIWQRIEREGLIGAPREPDPERFWAVVGGEDELSSDAPEAASSAQTPAALFNLGVVLQNQGLPEQAMEKYRACLELHPGYHHARANLGRLLLEAGRIEEATTELRRTLEDAPTHLRALLGLAEARRRAGDLDEAIALARRGTEADARSPAAWRLLGLLAFQRRELPEARRALARAVELAPESLSAQLQYGAVALGLDELDVAERAFGAARALAPDDNRARNGLAAVAAKRGDYNRARELYGQSLSFDPQDGQAQSGLAAVERLAGGNR